MEEGKNSNWVDNEQLIKWENSQLNLAYQTFQLDCWIYRQKMIGKRRLGIKFGSYQYLVINALRIR